MQMHEDELAACAMQSVVLCQLASSPAHLYLVVVRTAVLLLAIRAALCSIFPLSCFAGFLNFVVLAISKLAFWQYWHG